MLTGAEDMLGGWLMAARGGSRWEMHSAFSGGVARALEARTITARQEEMVAPAAERDKQERGEHAHRASNVLDGLSCCGRWRNERLDAAHASHATLSPRPKRSRATSSEQASIGHRAADAAVLQHAAPCIAIDMAAKSAPR